MLDVNIFRYRKEFFLKKIVLKCWVSENKEKQFGRHVMTQLSSDQSHN